MTDSPTLDRGDDPYAVARRWWLCAVFFSVLGGGMVGLANAHIVYDRTRSVAITGLITVCASLPPLLLPAVSTILAQRFGGPRTYIARYASSAVVAFVPVMLLTNGHLTTPMLLIWSASMSFIAGLFMPSSSLVQRMLAPPGKLPEFTAEAGRNAALAGVIGILGGGVVYETIGPIWIYAINAISFIPLVIPMIPLLGNVEPAEAARHRFGSVWGLLYGPQSRPGLRAACRFTFLSLALGGYTVVLPAIAGTGRGSAGALSLLQAATVVGGLVTVVVTRRLHGLVPWGQAQRVCFLVTGVGILVLAWASRPSLGPTATLVVCVVAIIPIGLALKLDQTILQALVQMATTASSRAVFFTYYGLIPMVAVPVGQMAIGVIADRLSVSVALYAMAALTLVLVAMGPRLAMRAAFDDLADADAPPEVCFCGSTGMAIDSCGSAAAAHACRT